MIVGDAFVWGYLFGVGATALVGLVLYLALRRP